MGRVGREHLEDGSFRDKVALRRFNGYDYRIHEKGCRYDLVVMRIVNK